MSIATTSLPAVWAIGAVDGCTLIEVCKYHDKFVVVERNADGTLKRIDSKRGMALDRAKARATWLAGIIA